MSHFSEFDQQGSAPNRNTGSIISHAFEMYKGVFLYAFITMVVYLLLDSVLQSITGLNSWSYLRNLKDADFDGDYYRQWNRPGASLYYSGSGILSILLSPLFVGLIYITNKFNNKVHIEFTDLFIGYRQNLGNILLYSLISTVILSISFVMCFFPVLFVFPLFLLGYPILLFENASAIDALGKTYNIARENYGIFLGTALLGLLISISGLVFCCVGIVFTYPFIYITMYSAYCAYLGKPRQITHNK